MGNHNSSASHNYLMADLNKYRPLPQIELFLLIARAQAGDKEALEKVTLHNSGLVIKYAGKFCDRLGHTWMDLFQVGMMGLSHSVFLFDLSRKHRFSTYAVHWIKQYMMRHIKNDVLIHLPEYIDNKVRIYNKDRDKFLQSNDEHSSIIEEIANMVIISLDMPVFVNIQSDAMSILEIIPDDTYSEHVRPVATWYIKQAMESNLNAREIELIERRFGMENYLPHSLEDLGIVLGISRERVRQIEKVAMSKLREYLIRIMPRNRVIL